MLLYSETNVTVISADKIKTVVRDAYKILRPGGRDYGTPYVYLNANRKITSLRGWCIPAQGKDYDVKDKEAMEMSPPKIDGSELISDVKLKLLRIPASDPGNIVGYEYEVEEHPLVLQDAWLFQESNPVRERRYSLQMPAGWEYKASFLNYPEVKPTQSGNGQWQWSVSDIKGVRKEDDMPPLRGLLGQMIVSFYPPGGPTLNGFANWEQMGRWYQGLTNGRFDSSPEIKQKVNTLTSLDPSQLAKMRALAQFVQRDIRYVAIELGIGGWQPHPATEVFAHRYGDCKDKATLMATMLREIGIDSYHVVLWPVCGWPRVRDSKGPRFRWGEVSHELCPVCFCCNPSFCLCDRDGAIVSKGGLHNTQRDAEKPRCGRKLREQRYREKRRCACCRQRIQICAVSGDIPDHRTSTYAHLSPCVDVATCPSATRRAGDPAL